MNAITRGPSPTLADCELTHIERRPIDATLAARQHDDYCRALQECGAELLRLDPEPHLPDAVFVEDTALLLDGLSILARPGAVSRHAELESIAPLLARFGPVLTIEAPGTLDGGDVLRLGRTLRPYWSPRPIHRRRRSSRGRASPLVNCTSGSSTKPRRG